MPRRLMGRRDWMELTVAEAALKQGTGSWPGQILATRPSNPSD